MNRPRGVEKEIMEWANDPFSSANDPFAGREKQVIVRSKEEALAKLIQHRKEAHGTDDLDEFFDCSGCGVLERQLENAV